MTTNFTTEYKVIDPNVIDKNSNTKLESVGKILHNFKRIRSNSRIL